MNQRDQQAQTAVASATRQLGRRSFLGKAAQAVAGGIATVVIGPGAWSSTAFASTSPSCSPPCGRYCGGCTSSGGCPGGYVNCVPSSYGYSPCCPYNSSWWYTANSAGNRHLCRDCVSNIGPVTCSGACTGYCGCRSSIYY